MTLKRARAGQPPIISEKFYAYFVGTFEFNSDVVAQQFLGEDCTIIRRRNSQEYLVVELQKMVAHKSIVNELLGFTQQLNKRHVTV